MRVVNTDALSSLKKAPEKCLHKAEKGKKKMYLEACLQQRHELLDGVADLAGKAFTPSHVRDDPLIYSGRDVSSTKPTPAGSTKPNSTGETPAAPEVTEQKGELLIPDLW